MLCQSDEMGVAGPEVWLGNTDAAMSGDCSFCEKLRNAKEVDRDAHLRDDELSKFSGTYTNF